MEKLQGAEIYIARCGTTLTLILNKSGYSTLNREITSSGHNIFAIRFISQNTISVFEITGIGPFFR